MKNSRACCGAPVHIETPPNGDRKIQWEDLRVGAWRELGADEIKLLKK